SCHHVRFELRVLSRMRSPLRSLCRFNCAGFTESSSLISITRQGPITASNGTASRVAPSLIKWFKPFMCVPAWQHRSILDTLQMAPLNGLNHLDRKSTRLNSSHVAISYAVFCLKKK